IACGVGRKFTSDNLQERYAMPTAVAQQLVGARQGLDAVIDRSNEIRSRRIGALCLENDGTDRCEDILYASVEFGMQHIALLLSLLALGDVDVHADQAFCVAGLVILYETARLDPADRAARTHNAKLCVMLAAPLYKYLLAMLKILRQVLWVD